MTNLLPPCFIFFVVASDIVIPKFRYREEERARERSRIEEIMRNNKISWTQRQL